MASKSRKTRGRPPKVPVPANRSNFLRKPKAFAGFLNSCVGNGSLSRYPSYNNYNERVKGRVAVQRGRNFVSSVITDDDDVSSVFDADNDDRGSEFTDHDVTENFASDDSCVESDVGISDDSVSNASFSKRKFCQRRPKTPELLDDKDIPHLELPASSTDLIISSEYLMQAVGIYEVLRRFRTNLRLSPFLFEDFCSSLLCDEHCLLVAEIHICLLKAIFREEDSNMCLLGPHDTKDSINICLFFLGGMTWPEVARAYLESDKHPEFQAALPALTSPNFPFVSLPEKLQVLQTLTDLFLTTTSVRLDITNEGNIRYDDHCRSCHK